MKKLRYEEWEIHLFRHDLDEIPVYYATCLDMAEVCISFDSCWEAYELLKRRLDKIADDIQASHADMDEDELPF
jgi:hypothetical protein